MEEPIQWKKSRNSFAAKSLLKSASLALVEWEKHPLRSPSLNLQLSEPNMVHAAFGFLALKPHHLTYSCNFSMYTCESSEPPVTRLMIYFQN
jgi:hypothetical protein